MWIFHNCLQPITATSSLWQVVYVCLLPIAFHPIRVLDQLVRFLVLVDTDSVVRHLLSVEKEESGPETWIQSPALVRFLLLIMNFHSCIYVCTSIYTNAMSAGSSQKNTSVSRGSDLSWHWMCDLLVKEQSWVNSSNQINLYCML